MMVSELAVAAALTALATAGVSCSHPAASGDHPETAAAHTAAPESAPSLAPADAAADAPRVSFAPAGKPAASVVVEVARTPAQRERGLMYRRNLPPDHGMLFLFATPRVQTFWMKNTLVPLDMIFIRSNMTVAGVVADATPLTETPRKVDSPSRYVLEVNAGWAKAHAVTAGTQVSFENVAGAGSH